MVKSSVRFGYADRRLALKGKRSIQLAVCELVKCECRTTCRLQYVFCSDEYLHGINVSFLQHDDYTDIITFDLSDDPKTLIVGEIYISLDRVAANARELGLPFEQEAARVIFHGALHLCGFGDKTKVAKAEMRAKEDEYLKKYGIL